MTGWPCCFNQQSCQGGSASAQGIKHKVLLRKVISLFMVMGCAVSTDCFVYPGQIQVQHLFLLHGPGTSFQIIDRFGGRTLKSNRCMKQTCSLRKDVRCFLSETVWNCQRWLSREAFIKMELSFQLSGLSWLVSYSELVDYN